MDKKCTLVDLIVVLIGLIFILAVFVSFLYILIPLLDVVCGALGEAGGYFRQWWSEFLRLD